MLDIVRLADMVGTVVFLTVRALHHLVGKTFNMPGCYVDCLFSDGGALNLEVAFAGDVVIAPEVLYLSLHHRAERTVINKPRNRAVNLGRRPYKASPLCKFHNFVVNVSHFIVSLLNFH